MVWSLETSKGAEALKIAPFIVPYTRGRGLDIGCNAWSPFPHFLGIDLARNDKGAPVAKLCADGTDLSMFADNSWDFVFSSHFLEHVKDTEAALAEWWRVIRPGGHLVLYLPDKRHYPNIGCYGSNPDHKFDFLPEDILGHMQNVARASRHGWDCLENEVRSDDDEYSFYLVLKKHAAVNPDKLPACNMVPWRKPEKNCLVIRYGALGDHLMTSSVFPKLKEQGYHVTYNCDPRGEMLLAGDPNIDAFLVQDTDQVPNNLLGPYWGRLLERYDDIFNLSESIEGQLLAVPGRFNHGWPDEVRRKVMGTVNYLDRTHDLCGVERDPQPQFYPTDEEKKWARRTLMKARYGSTTPTAKQRRNPNLVILWGLSGSAKHKFWPHMDKGIERLLAELPVTILLTGDVMCQLIEADLDDHPRVWKRSGQWGIRETLALAQMVDIVIGPETGVLNAVSMDEAVHKVIYLSHSSHENLTRDWVKTRVLQAQNLECSPCHRLHYTSDYCPSDPRTNAALCAQMIPVDAVVGAIVEAAAEIRS